jgi:hypothetical protein
MYFAQSLTSFGKIQIRIPKQARLVCTEPTKNYGLLKEIRQRNELIVLDTFWIKNIGNTSTTFTLEYANYFFIDGNKENDKIGFIKAGDSIAIYYYRVHKPNNDWLSDNRTIPGIQYITDYGTVQYDNRSITLASDYLVNVNYTKPEQTIHAYGNTESQYLIQNISKANLADTSFHFYYCIVTDSNGLLKEVGKKMGPSKIGDWLKVIRDDKGKVVKYDHEATNKLLTISLYDDTIGNCNIGTTYLWSHIDGNFQNNKIELSFLIPFNIASFNISNKNGSIRQIINFAELKEIDELKLYLLREGQQYYRSGNIKIPLDT